MKKIKRYYHRLCKIIDFIKIGAKDYDWSYDYLLDIEEYKYRKMYKYFSNADSTESEWEHARNLKIMISLLNIIKERDSAYILIGVDEAPLDDKNLSTIEPHFIVNPDVYVNTRNASRFLNDYMLKHLNKDDRMYAIMYNDLRVEKAWNLYNKIRSEKLRTWLD